MLWSCLERQAYSLVVLEGYSWTKEIVFTNSEFSHKEINPIYNNIKDN